MRRFCAIAGAALVLGVPSLVPPAALVAQTKATQAKGTGATAATSVSPESLDLLLAPIALYPDQLLAQMLLCAQNPAQVQQLADWLKKTTSLKGTQLQDAAGKAGFEPSFVALALFPQVVNLMAGDLNWTTRIGQAFTANRGAVFDSIQRLRAQSREVGNLKTTEQQKVETRTTDAGQQVIVIEPANPQVVYVPQYNPQVVYTQPASTTVVVQEESHAGEAAAAGVIGFAAGIAIGAAIDNDYYYGPYGWHGGGYMYNDAWEDYYDDRQDAREDWYENREDAREDIQENRKDVASERTQRTDTRQQERTERTQAREQTSPQTQAQREQRRTDAQAQRQAQGVSTQAQGASTQARTTSSSYESRGTSRSGTSVDRSGRSSDAFSGYSSGRSERAASSRGQRSRSSSGRGGGGGRRR